MSKPFSYLAAHIKEIKGCIMLMHLAQRCMDFSFESKTRCADFKSIFLGNAYLAAVKVDVTCIYAKINETQPRGFSGRIFKE